MKDLSTLEYLYDLRCCRASSDTHSCFAVSAFLVYQQLFGETRNAWSRTFARRHGGGLGDRRWERHGCKGGLD